MKRTGPMIVFLGMMQYAYPRGVVRGVAKYANVHRWDLRLLDVALPEPPVEMLRRCDGLIADAAGKWVEYVDAWHGPVVTIQAGWETVAHVRVMSDDQAVGAMGAEHFLAHGFRHFAFVEHGGYWAGQRQKGFMDRVEAAGFAVKVLTGGPRRVISDLAKLPRPLAIMAPNDESAAEIMRLCHRREWAIPQEVAILGVDDDELACQTTDPPLSSIRLQNEQIGYQAADLLSRIIAGESVEARDHLIPPGSLHVRESSDVLAVEDALVAEALRLIHEHLADGVIVKTLLRRLNCSRTTLDEHFRRTLGRTPAAEIRRLRMERAGELLRSSDLPIADIGRRIGIPDPRQFSQTFHQQTGHCPSTHRRVSVMRVE